MTISVVVDRQQCEGWAQSGAEVTSAQADACEALDPERYDSSSIWAIFGPRARRCHQIGRTHLNVVACLDKRPADVEYTWSAWTEIMLQNYINSNTND